MQPEKELSRNTFCRFLVFLFLLILGTPGLSRAAGSQESSGGGGLTFVLSDFNGFNVSCNGSSDGSIDLTPSGTAPYTYLWSNGATTEDLSGLPAGSYTVTVTDFVGLIQTQTVTLTEPSLISVVLNSVQNVLCKGASTGSISINVSGGVPGYTFLWSNGATTQDISSVVAGTYTVTVSDVNNCTAQFSETISEPLDALTATTNTNSPNCVGNNGSATVTASGGTGAYSYLWSTGNTTQTINGLGVGTYTVTVTDANNCTFSTIAQVNSVQGPSIANALATNLSCAGANTGAIDITITGGSGSINYLWSSGQTTEDLTSLAPGTYTVTVTDQSNCTATGTYTITSPSPVSISFSTTNPGCVAANGSATANVSGGTPGYTYLWSTGATTAGITSLSAGTYTVTVSDIFNCTATSQVTLNPSTPPSITLVSQTNPNCNGSSNGSIDISVSGGTGTYSYQWSNSGITQDLTGLIAGTYTVTVTDQANCTATASYTLTNPSSIVISFSTTNPSCLLSNGSATANVTGGNPGYTYLWSTGATTATISNLPAGTYTVTVTDNTLCTASSQVTLASASAPVITLVSQINPNCNGGNNGSIDISVSGGTGVYTYLWSNLAISEDISGLTAGTYTVTVTDVLLCSSTASFTLTQPAPFLITPAVTNASCGLSNGTASVSVSGNVPPYTYLWSTGSTISAISGLAAGNYTVTVTGNTGCTSVQTLSVTGSTVLNIVVDSVTNVNCQNVNSGAIYISVSGATAPFTYNWSNGAVVEDLTNIPAGTYTVTATSFDGCVGSISATVNPAGTISLSLSATPADCGQANGTATANPSGGTFPYTYLWSNGSTTATISNLAGGTFTVTVTDFTGCSRTDSIQVQNNGAPVINVINQSNPNCNGNGGSIHVNAQGGSGGYSYSWSNGDTGPQINNLGFGTYTVTVTDNSNCTATASFNLGSALSVSVASTQNNLCAGGTDGSVLISVTGGLPSYSFLWSNNATTQNIGSLPSGTYTVTVTDANNCTAQVSATITDPNPLSIQGVISNVSCSGNDGAIDITVSGGVGTYSYGWSNGQTTEDITGLSTGTFTVTVTDGNGCTKSDVFTVGSSGSITASFQLIQPVLCNGTSSAILNVTPAGGQPGYTYLWSNNETTQQIAFVAAGIYTVTISDNSGCSASFTDTITEPDPIYFSSTVTLPSCGNANGVLAVQGNGGTQPYTYLWSNGIPASAISNLAAGIYTVTITDFNNCQSDTTFNLQNSGSISIAAVVDSISCFGVADGAIDLTITGGQPNYQFTWINTPQTTEDVSGLTAGSYSVIVTDQSGCTASQSFTLSQPAPVTVAFTLLQNAACGNSNGGVIASASGTFGPFTYLWSTGAQTAGLFNVAAGTYTVTATDTKGCTATKVANINNNTGPVISSVDSGMVSCYGGNNGFITINVTGTAPPFSYAWTGSSATTSSISNLIAGIYSLQITDAQGCITVRSVTVTQPDSIRVNPVIPQLNPPYNLSCFNANDGSVLLSVNGGTAPYNFLWSNGSTSQNIQGLSAGPYTVIVTDQQGCSISHTYTLTQPPSLNANGGADVTICGTDSYVMQAQVPANGVGFWTAVTFPGINTFSDSTSANTTVDNLQEGDNVFLWTVQLGSCTSTVQITITRGTSIVANAGTDLTICESVVTLSATNPQFGFGFWRSFTPGVIISNTSAAVTGVENLQLGNNIFLWTVVSGNCRDSAEINIYRNDSLDCLSIIRLPNAFSPNEDGYNDVFLIKGLADFPDNNLTILNRWGVVVYETDNYKNDWDGRGLNNTPVTDGTYYVILRVRSIDKVFTTFLDLRR